ncbi:MAG: hypothetical protein ACTHM9_06285 [Gemmatimonadales bacterium]
MIHLSFPLLAACGALLSGRRAVRPIWCATVAGGIGLAALQAGDFHAPFGAERVADLPLGFIGAEGALFLTAAVLAVGGAWLAAVDRRGPTDVLAAAGAAAGGLWIGSLASRFLATSGAGVFLPAVLVLAALVLLVRFAGRRWPAPPLPADLDLRPTGVLPVILAGAILAAFAPWAGPVFVGVIIASVGGYLALADGARRLPVSPLLALMLVPAWWLMRTIAGPEGLPVRGLADLPWSPAAELALAPVLLVSAWSLAGLWPLHRQVPALLTAPVGALLVARVVVPVAPDGLAHWRALAMPLIVLGLWHATLTRRRAASVAGLAWIGLLAGERSGEVGAALLFAGTMLLAGSEWVEGRERMLALGARVVGAVSAACGAVLVAAAGLHVEVVYTVLAVAALALAAARAGPIQASTASAPSATAASA